MTAMSLHLLAQASTAVNPNAGFELSAAGWFMMLISVGSVTVVLAWCLSRVLRETPGKLHSPIDIEPPDERADREAH